MHLPIEKLDEIVANLEKQIDNCHKLIQTCEQMRRIFLLAKLEPRVTEGRFAISYRNHDRWRARPRDALLVIKLGPKDGDKWSDEVTFPLTKVPEDFWPEDLLIRERRLRAKNVFRHERRKDL